MTQSTSLPDPMAPPDRFPMTKAARMARDRLHRHLEGFGNDVMLWRRVQQKVPAAWSTVEQDIDCEEPKVKITLRVDASVARLFRAMGKGYQNRINHVLATYVQMQIGEVRRLRRREDEVDEFLRGRIAPEMAEYYRKNRDKLAENEDIDIEGLDQLFGVR